MKNRGVTVVLGVSVFFAVVVLVMLWAGSLSVFVNIPILLFVVGITGGLGLAAYKGGGLLDYIGACKRHCISASALGTEPATAPTGVGQPRRGAGEVGLASAATPEHPVTEPEPLSETSESVIGCAQQARPLPRITKS